MKYILQKDNSRPEINTFSDIKNNLDNLTGENIQINIPFSMPDTTLKYFHIWYSFAFQCGFILRKVYTN